MTCLAGLSDDLSFGILETEVVEELRSDDDATEYLAPPLPRTGTLFLSLLTGDTGDPRLVDTGR